MVTQDWKRLLWPLDNRSDEPGTSWSLPEKHFWVLQVPTLHPRRSRQWISLRDKPLLLARASNDIILSGMSYALWISRWVSILQPLSVTTCLTLLNGGLQVPHCFSVGFITFALMFDVMQATRKPETIQGEEVDWRLFIFLVPSVLYIIITIFSFLFDMWAIFTYVCMCVYARTHVHMLAGPCIGTSIWKPKVDVGGLPLLLSALFIEVF